MEKMFDFGIAGCEPFGDDGFVEVTLKATVKGVLARDGDMLLVTAETPAGDLFMSYGG